MLIAKGEEIKQEALAHPDVRAWIDSLWRETKQGILSAIGPMNRANCASESTATASRLGERLQHDESLQHKIDDWAQRSVAYIIENYRSEVSNLIETNVASLGWRCNEPQDGTTGRPRPAVHPDQRHHRRWPRRTGHLHPSNAYV